MATHRIKLLEDKLSLTDRENSNLLRTVAATEAALAESRSRCPVDRNSNDEVANDVDVDAMAGEVSASSNRTISGLVQLLNHHHGNLLASRQKVKMVEKENSDLRKDVFERTLKISELEEQLRDSEARLSSMSEELESAAFEVDFCKAELMEKEAEIADVKTELNKVQASVLSGNSELNLCRKKFEQEFKDEQERLWDGVWKKQNYGMCVQACNMMKTAACKIAFNYLPYKDYLIDCS